MKSQTHWYVKKHAWHLRYLAALPSKRKGRFLNGHVYIGTASKHRTKPARLSNLLIRLRMNRS